MSDSNFEELTPLKDGEEELTDAEELYYRQCHPDHFEDGEPTAQMFKESSVDKGELSGSRSSKAHAQEVFEHRSKQGEERGKVVTVGTYAVSVEDISAVGTRAVDDSALQSAEAPPGHTYLDLRHLGSKPKTPDKRRVWAGLLIASRKYGRLWPQEADSPT